MSKTDKTSFTYIPVNDTVDRVGLYVTGVGNDWVVAGESYPRQKHPELYDFTWAKGRILPEFQLLFIAAGRGVFESEATGRLEVKPGTLITLFPDVWHRYRPDSKTGWEEYWVSLGGDLLFQWHERGLFSAERPIVEVAKASKTTKDFQELLRLTVQTKDSNALRLTAVVMKIIASTLDNGARSPISEVGVEADGSPADDIVQQALHIIWNHSHQQISIDMIAKLIRVNRRTLERRFKSQLGRTPLQELVNCRLQRAKRLLRETRVPIKYVAYAAGFSSISNLCKVFQRELRISPGEYRKGLPDS